MIDALWVSASFLISSNGAISPSILKTPSVIIAVVPFCRLIDCNFSPKESMSFLVYDQGIPGRKHRGKHAQIRHVASAENNSGLLPLKLCQLELELLMQFRSAG